jgi:hypothetical protein
MVNPQPERQSRKKREFFSLLTPIPRLSDRSGRRRSHPPSSNGFQMEGQKEQSGLRHQTAFGRRGRKEHPASVIKRLSDGGGGREAGPVIKRLSNGGG